MCEDPDDLLRFNCLSRHIVPKKGSVQFSPSDLVSLISFVRERQLVDTKEPSTPRAEAEGHAWELGHIAWAMCSSM